jgi:hypothetical protein
MHIGVDPYGDRVYQHIDNQENCQWDGLEKGVAPTYSDTMRDKLCSTDLKSYRNRRKISSSQYDRHIIYDVILNIHEKKYAFHAF